MAMPYGPRSCASRRAPAGLALTAAIAIALGGCTDAKDAQRVLEEQGYTDIQTNGYAPFACGGGDTFATGFSARSPNGRPVRGVVCKGWLKGSTVRSY